MSADDRLDPAVREQALTAYGKAIKLVEAARASEAAARDFQQAADAAPKQAEDLRRLLAPGGDLGVPPLPTEDPAASASDLEQALAGAQANAAALRSRVEELTEAARTLEARPTAANVELREARQQLQALDDGVPESGGEPAVAEARAAQRAAQRRAYAARIHMLEQELAVVPARRDLVQAQVSVASARRALVDTQVAEVQARLQRLLQRGAAVEQQQADRAALELANRHQLIVAEAGKNADLSRKLTDLVRQLSQVPETKRQTEVERAKLAEIQAAARDAMSIGSGGEDFSAVLREIRGDVPSVSALAREVIKRKQAILDGRLARLKLREQLRLLGNLPAATARTLATWTDATLPLPADATAIVEGLLGKRREILPQAIQAHGHLIDRLRELNELQQNVHDGAAELAEALHERLLWLPSAPPLGTSFGEDLVVGVRWAMDPPGGWASVLSHCLARALAALPITALVLLVLLGITLSRRRLQEQLRDIAERVGRVGSDAHHLTPQAIGISMLLVAPSAALPIFVGVLLHGGTGEPFARSVGQALIGVGVLLAILRTFGQMCRQGGVFGAHFGWSDRSRRVLGSNLRWLILVLVPVALVVTITDAGGKEHLRYGLGRLAFISASVALSLVVYRVLHPTRGAFADMLSQGGLLWRSRSVWFPALYLAPVALGLLAGYGYLDTAAMIQQRFFTTGWVSLVGVVGYSVIMRFVVVAHRRMALRRAQESRDLARAARAQKSAAEAAGEAIPELEIPKIDLSSVSQQTRTLIRATVGLSILFALWMVWSQLFPALAVLDEVPAWERLVTTEKGIEKVAVYWGAVLAALLIGAVTMLAYRNLPGLLEITFFQRGGVDSGTRYAATTITRYLIVMVGLVIAFDRLGWDWSKAQWIVAALGVGLGFGLQEIVANFVSGLIILFERPVRVGDTITVGDLSGTVSRLQIRATTITDWDNREIIVPNKDLITGRVVNWTLSTPVTRLVLKVGVAYGTDTERVQQLMLKTAKGIPNVMATPAPSVFFLGFGDSSLNFEVRVFVGELSHRLPVMHELHTQIHLALAQGGFEIPFPQRDLHIRSSPPAIPPS